nr:ATP-binding protein [Pontibacillus sp. HN14]
MYQNTDAPLWLSRLLFNLSEKERARLASDLHDEALQEQLVWYRKIEAMVEDEKMPDHFEEELFEVKEGLLGVVQQIRETCTFLRPPFLRETGIVEALNQLMDYYRMRSDYQVDFDAETFKATLDHEHSLAIYRVVQELLNNATKHSGASCVEFELKSSQGMIVLNYKDDGVGLPDQQTQDLSKGMGLAGIKQRVKSLEGHVEFLSSEEGGLELSLALFMK